MVICYKIIFKNYNTHSIIVSLREIINENILSSNLCYFKKSFCNDDSSLRISIYIFIVRQFNILFFELIFL